MAKGVLKEISKLNKIPHPKSRKTAQLTRKAIRCAARDKQKTVNLMKQNIIGEKFMWFKERINSASEVTPARVLELIEKYLARFDEELEQIQLKHSVGQRKGRQHASREDVIKMTKRQEMNEFNTCGLEMPDLLNPKQLTLLLSWEGELRFLQNFKIVRYRRTQLENLVEKLQVTEEMDEEVEEEEGRNETIAEEEDGDEAVEEEEDNGETVAEQEDEDEANEEQEDKDEGNDEQESQSPEGENMEVESKMDSE